LIDGGEPDIAVQLIIEVTGTWLDPCTSIDVEKSQFENGGNVEGGRPFGRTLLPLWTSITAAVANGGEAKPMDPSTVSITVVEEGFPSINNVKTPNANRVVSV
jgi:hypothetical protein